MRKNTKLWSDQAEVDYGHCLTLLSSFFPDEAKAITWMAVKNPMLGDYSPQDMIRLGRTAQLVKFIRAAEEIRT
jgi:uncharacterized protein (DUF2384 family)